MFRDRCESFISTTILNPQQKQILISFKQRWKLRVKRHGSQSKLLSFFWTERQKNQLLHFTGFLLHTLVICTAWNSLLTTSLQALTVGSGFIEVYDLITQAFNLNRHCTDAWKVVGFFHSEKTTEGSARESVSKGKGRCGMPAFSSCYITLVFHPSLHWMLGYASHPDRSAQTELSQPFLLRFPSEVCIYLNKTNWKTLSSRVYYCTI